MSQATVAIVGGGPAGLTLALHLGGQRSLSVTLYDADEDPFLGPRYSTGRSYTIDITGHGRKAVRSLGLERDFAEGLLPFEGIRQHSHDGTKVVRTDGCEAGWTGSRGDIMRVLTTALRERHGGRVAVEYNTKVTHVDAIKGDIVVQTAAGTTETKSFDLVVGSDGAGSTVLQGMTALPGFSVTRQHITNHATMISLDQAVGKLDPAYLHILGVHPSVMIAGAVNGEDGNQPAQCKWFCMVAFDHNQTFDSLEAVKAFFTKNAPAVLSYASEKSLMEFQAQPCYHLGKTRICSSLFGGKCVLLGDAATAFPPVGQGINAAMESAMVLGELLVKAEETSAESLRAAVSEYSKRWKPEADAMAWIANRWRMGNLFSTVKCFVTGILGTNAMTHAKDASKSYSQVAKTARFGQFAFVSGLLLAASACAMAAVVTAVNVARM